MTAVKTRTENENRQWKTSEAEFCVFVFCMGGWTTVFPNSKISGSGCGWKTATALTPSFRSISRYTQLLYLNHLHHTHRLWAVQKQPVREEGSRGSGKGERGRAREGGAWRSKHRVVPRLYIALCHSYRPPRSHHFRGETCTHTCVWHRHQVCVMNALLYVISRWQLRFYGCY